MIGYIYIHTNKINGKKYIGQTILKPEDRWQNGTGYKRCPKFWNAIKKYGWDNFEHKIIPAYPEELDFLECEFIKKYNTIKNGYNSCSGGNKNKIFSEESKRKMSISKKGKTPSNYINFIIGRKSSKRNSKKVMCIETNEIFESGAIASKKYNIHRCAISKAIIKNQRAASYHWRYVE